jgi:hypothetical protein
VNIQSKPKEYELPFKRFTKLLEKILKQNIGHIGV